MADSDGSEAAVATLGTPINLILISLLIFTLYLRLRPKSASAASKHLLPKGPTPIIFQTFTPPTLRPFNGEEGRPVYMGVRGRVFDVSSGRNFYGPGGPYQNFAGRDASRGLACGSFDEEMLTKDLGGPLDDMKDLGADEMEALRGWEEKFNEKYLVVGKLVAVAEKEREDKERADQKKAMEKEAEKAKS